MQPEQHEGVGPLKTSFSFQTHFIRLLRTARREANRLAALALSSLTVKVLVFNRVPALFYGAHELGLIVEPILASIVASYVLYLIVVHLKEQSDKATIRPYIAKHTTRVVGDCQSQLTEISRVTGTEISLANASKELITDAFKKIARYSEAPLFILPNVQANCSSILIITGVGLAKASADCSRSYLTLMRSS